MTVGGRDYHFVSLRRVADSFGDDALKDYVARLPRSMKVLFENMVRHGADETQLVSFLRHSDDCSVTLHPARILMQDFTALPALVDLAALRDAVQTSGGEARRVNPVIPLDVVVDHSISVDAFASHEAQKINEEQELKRNSERYRFLKWGQQAFVNMRLIPPGSGICHQVNLEHLAQLVVVRDEGNKQWLYPDSVLGTDSHTTMVNGLGVLGWGVGGIEAEAAMLGLPLSMALPKVVGCRLQGQLGAGVTATDLVLTVTQTLRQHGVVGSFVEFTGDALNHLSLADRATIANMAPEYGATCGFFPIDDETIRYLALTGRDETHCGIVKAYAQEQGLWHNASEALAFDESVAIDCRAIEPCVAGPTRPQDRVTLAQVPQSFADFNGAPPSSEPPALRDGAVVIAAITSCTNTSNAELMLTAGLLARAARRHGLHTKPWVKTSLAPGSRVVTAYLQETGLLEDLEYLGFHVVGYGCTTCIGNSGPLSDDVAQTVREKNLCVASVLSGNRNFEGRIHPQVQANYLASPPLVIGYALLGVMDASLLETPLGVSSDGKNIFLADLWPSSQEVAQLLKNTVTSSLFVSQYQALEQGGDAWQEMQTSTGQLYDWHDSSTYVRSPPFFDDDGFVSDGFTGARALAVLGDSVTTDHISPASAIPLGGDAAHYLQQHGVAPIDFNSFGARRGNHEVMMRGTLANIRLRNRLADGKEGGWTRRLSSTDLVSMYEAAQWYQEQDIPLVIVAGHNYGSGSSRDWAAKGVRLLGVRAVIAQSFERIHRSNLIGMGVMPLTLPADVSVSDLNLTGDETFDCDIPTVYQPRLTTDLRITKNGHTQTLTVRVQLHTQQEMDTYQRGGLLPMMREKILADASFQL